MDNFNFKKFLFENSLGAYSKAEKIQEVDPATLGMDQAEADTQMQMQDDQNGDMVDNASMGTVAEAENTTIQIQEEPFFILGKEYIVSGEVEIDYEYEKPDYEDQQMISAGGYVVTDAKITISELFVEEGDSYRPVQDPKAIKQIQDLINTDPKLKRNLEDISTNKVADSLEEEDVKGEQIGIGYAMKVKKPIENI